MLVGQHANFGCCFRLKEKEPHAFDSIELYNRAVEAISNFRYKLTTRRFVQELFQDAKFTEVGSLLACSFTANM